MTVIELINSFRIIWIIGERPEALQPKQEWLVLTAPRPLHGHVKWNPAGQPGCFFVGVDLREADAGGLLLYNKSQDAELVEQLSEPAFFELACERMMQRFPDTAADYIAEPGNRQSIVSTYVATLNRPR